VLRYLKVFAAQPISNKLVKFITNRSLWSSKRVLTVKPCIYEDAQSPNMEQPAEDIRLSEGLFTEDAFLRSKT